MVEVSHLIESAFRESQGSLRRAAIRTIAGTSPQTTLRELLDSDAGTAIRSLSLKEFMQALSELRERALPDLVLASSGDLGTKSGVQAGGPASPTRRVIATDSQANVSDQERAYRGILAALEGGQKSISEISSRTGVDILKLRQYLRWMEDNGKVARDGRARGTRYYLPR
jgi:hypothetical protein